MKQHIVAWAILLLCVPWGLRGEEAIRVLAVDEPTPELAKKNTMLVHFAELESLVSGLTAEHADATIVLLDPTKWAMASLGSIKKGQVKWDYKKAKERFLAVEMTPSNYALLAGILKVKMPNTGCWLAVCDPKTGGILASVPVTFWEFPDLAVQLDYPVNAQLGENLQDNVSVVLVNRGGAPARDIRVVLAASPDEPFAWQGATGNDQLLANGQETVPLLEPGQQLTIRFSNRLLLPADMAPGKHYLGVAVDPAGAIVELDKANNVHSGFIMVAAPEPAAFTVDIPETRLVFQPADYGFQIVYDGMVISDGKDWKLCRMKPSVYQIKHVSWKDFFWEIDTIYRKVYEITGAEFCKKGGKDRTLNIKVEVSGGSMEVPPSRITLKLAQTILRYEPGIKKFALEANDRSICHLPFWWVCRREPFLYQVRCALWQDFFWQVNTFSKEASKVSGGKFCSPEGTAAAMPLKVTVWDKEP